MCSERFLRLSRADYDLPSDELAKSLLGCYFVRKLSSGQVLKGVIVETECYPGLQDEASHSYRGKTRRNYPMFLPPGTSYVYQIYGLYYCVNVSSRGDGAAVLIRAVEPVAGFDTMRNLRAEVKSSKKNKKNGSSDHCPTKKLKNHQLCNGPAKLCSSFNINLTCNAQDLTTWDEMWMEKSPNGIVLPFVSCRRIGIGNYGEVAASKNYRFYIFGNLSVSQRDRVKEQDCIVAAYS